MAGSRIEIRVGDVAIEAKMAGAAEHVQGTFTWAQGMRHV